MNELTPKTKESAVKDEQVQPVVSAADEKQARIAAVVKAARHLQAGWLASAFYDRQDPADAEALITALDELKKGDV